MKSFTHKGTIEDYNYGNPRLHNVLLRETALFWVTEHDERYRKKDGMKTSWTMWTRLRLKLDTIKPIGD